MLNSQQEIAVAHDEGPLLVLAGAGAGKTRIVTQRIAKLLEKGVPAHQILAVTFTNKAAGEMQERVQSICQQRVLVSTFHSLGARILRESIHHLGYTSDFVIYDEEDSLKLIRACLKQLNIKDKKPKHFRGLISKAKSQLKDDEDDVYRLYQEQLKASNALDFDDLLFLTVRLLKEFPEVRAAYQARWHYLLIDEYQDTNHAQYLIARYLVEKHQNIFVVGDPDQSIYSWRGANLGNILDFENDYPGAKVVRLEQNYRSTNTILEAANALISKNESRYEKNLWSELGSGEPIREIRCQNDWEEAEWVADVIDRTEIPLSEIVVFYRTNAQSRQFEDALLRKRIPYTIVGGISFYHRREVKDILSLLRMVENGNDYIAFARTINLPKRGIGDATLEKIRLEALGSTLYDVCKNQTLKFSAKQKQGIGSYIATIDYLRQLKETAPLYEMVEAAISHSGYLAYLKEDPDTYQDRKANIDSLVGKAAEWDGDLTSFLEELSLKSTLDEAAIGDQCVTLMTIHNGKGLEYTLTFLAGMEEGLFPHINSSGDPEAIEEERRLCYVGMTRAKKYLYLTSATSRFLWGSSQLMRPSRFLREVPPEYKKIESSASGSRLAYR